MSEHSYDALLAAEELILDWTESLTDPETRRCPVRLSERAHDALVQRIATLVAETARLRKALEQARRAAFRAGCAHVADMHGPMASMTAPNEDAYIAAGFAGDEEEKP